MASNPPGQCCTIGVKHAGTPLGEIKLIGKTSTYIAPLPPTGTTTHGILIIPDVIGHEFPNSQLIADQFAANGYFTIMMDPFQGHAIPLNRPADFNIQKWIEGPPSKQAETVDPIVAAIIKEMRTTYNVKKLGLVGYCFGGKYVTRFLGPSATHYSTPVEAGYTAHPSFVTETELRSIRGSLSIAAAEVDSIFTEEKRHVSEAILKELSLGPDKVQYQMTLYSGVSHGFAPKGDPNDKRQKWAKEEAFLQAVRWFDFHLKGEGKD